MSIRGVVGAWVRGAVLLTGVSFGAAPVAAPLGAQDAAARAGAAARAVAAAREGGVTLLCRHAATDDFREREPLDYADPATQRRLSPEGLVQSDSIGRAWARLGIVLTDVVASPVDRAVVTAERIAPEHRIRIDSIWHTNDGDYRGPAREQRRLRLAEAVRGVRLVVSHISTMASVVPEVRNSAGEGDCAVVRGNGTGHEFIGVVPWERWLEPGLRPATPPPHFRDRSRSQSPPTHTVHAAP